jgi:hypothetical protein
MGNRTKLRIALSALVAVMLASAWMIVSRDAARHPAAAGAASGYVH